MKAYCRERMEDGKCFGHDQMKNEVLGASVDIAALHLLPVFEFFLIC